MESGVVTCSTTESERYSRRKKFAILVECDVDVQWNNKNTRVLGTMISLGE